MKLINKHFKIGQIWKDKQGYNWIILNICGNQIDSYCAQRSGVSVRNITDNGEHHSNDGCNFVSLVGEIKELEDLLEG
jgi:hypothetical protein